MAEDRFILFVHEGKVCLKFKVSDVPTVEQYNEFTQLARDVVGQDLLMMYYDRLCKKHLIEDATQFSNAVQTSDRPFFIFDANEVCIEYYGSKNIEQD